MLLVYTYLHIKKNNNLLQKKILSDPDMATPIRDVHALSLLSISKAREICLDL